MTAHNYLAGDLVLVTAPGIGDCEGIWEIMRIKLKLAYSDGSAYVCRREDDGAEETFMSDELAPIDAVTRLARALKLHPHRQGR